MYYLKRKDLQNKFPEVKDGNLKNLLDWAAYASQGLFDDKEAFELLNSNSQFYYRARDYDSFLPHPSYSSLPNLFFIFGAGRSGTTLLKRILNCHSMCFVLEEGFAYLSIQNPILMKLDKIFHANKKLLGLKTPLLSDCLLDKNFIPYPSQRYDDNITKHMFNIYSNDPIIFLVRDVRDRVSSAINLAKKLGNISDSQSSAVYESWIKKNPYIQKHFQKEINMISKLDNKLHAYLALDWKIKNLSFFAYQEKKYPVHLTKYEELVKHTKTQLEKIFSFLDIPYENSVIDFYRQPQADLKSAGVDSNYDDTKRIADTKSIELYKNFLTSDQINEIMDISSDMMTKLGY